MIVFLVVLETGQSQLWCQKEELVTLWSNPEKAKFPKRFFDNTGKKIKDDLF